MITLGRAAFQKESRVDEYYGKSTDEKPTDGIKNGSTLYLMDTKELFMFDADTSTWLPQQ